MTKRTHVVVALFAPITVGTSFKRSGWPAHVTLASNFLANATADELNRIVGRADVSSKPLSVQFTQLAQFGPNGDVPVRLVQSDGVLTLHNRLADDLALLPGFAAEEPAFWRDGYRPHLTLGDAITSGEGERWNVECIATAQLDGTDAEIVGSFQLPLAGERT
jgi:hypothetical protein